MFLMDGIISWARILYNGNTVSSTQVCMHDCFLILDVM